MEEKMEQQKVEAQEAALAEDGAKKVQEAVDEEALAEAKEAVENMQQEAEQKAEEATQTAARIAELKDELERLETGLPNAGATIRAIRDKQQKVPRRRPNTPDVNPGHADEIAAQEAMKYAGALGPMPGMVGGGLGMPSMAHPDGPRGPQGPVGPQNPVGPQGEAPVHQMPLPPADQPRTIQLDPKTLIEVELVSTKRRLADANERLALVALSDARKAKHAAEQEEAVLMARISKHYGIPYGKNLRLVDKEKGICQIEG